MVSTKDLNILNKIFRFLEFNSDEQTVINIKKNIGEGACHGFALCYAIMRRTNKIEWWTDALAKILAWDEKLESLEKKLLLRQADNNQPITLGMIFTRVIHYVYFAQGVLTTIGMSDLQYVNTKYQQFIFHDRIANTSSYCREF